MAGDGNEFQASHPVSGLYKSSPGSLADGDQDALRVDSAGLLRIDAVGNVAHDAADTGAPVKVGGRALATLPTAMSASDRSDLLTDLYGRLHVTAGQRAESWSVVHAAAANTQATASKAAGTAAQRHVCKGFMFTFASLGAPTPEQLDVVIRDGASGAGTIVWSGKISLPAVAGESKWIGMSGLYLVGTAATAMTAEFSAGGGANDYQSVSIFGETIPA